MKKIMLLCVVIATMTVACKKESTSPNTNPNENFNGDLINSIIINSPAINDSIYQHDEINTVINFVYDTNGKLLKLISTDNGKSEEYKFTRINGVLFFDTTGTNIKLNLNNDNLCVKFDQYCFIYEDGFLSKYGIYKGGKSNGYVIEKDSIVDCLWSNGNLISDGFHKYDYYEDKLNNNLFYLNPLFTSEVNTEGKPTGVFSALLQNYEYGGNFYLKLFGKPTKNLLKQISSNFGNEFSVSEFSYTMDSKNRIKEIQIKEISNWYAKGDITTITYNWK